ncbi:reverse transcriptase [Gossypium australe]|uniref:Reverse transcriptase n=1 Tax=Gossypium australe TaxID=47621 RepID=A0A5B6WIM8_9ROSI|nr:reverse transcriptase [Gossypium australe]
MGGYLEMRGDGSFQRGLGELSIDGCRVFWNVHLPHSFSDHGPLLIHTVQSIYGSRRYRFQFEAWWVLEESFMSEVENIWRSATGDLLNKLETLKKGLIEWVMRVRRHKEGIKKILKNILEDLNHGERDDENLAELIDTKILLNFDMEKEEMY